MAPDAEQIVGQNAWLVDEMHRQFLADPKSVSESWRDFFSDYRPDRVLPESATPVARLQAVPDPAEVAEPLPGDPLRGAAARIASNMEASLAIPTATSFREVPAKLLDVNRRIVNGYLGRTDGRKVS